MASKKDLYSEVDRLNKKYCSTTKNKLVVDKAYGGYQVCLTGKRYKNNPHKWRGIGSGCSGITHYHDTANNTLNALYRAESKGELRSKVRFYEKPRSKKR